MVSLAGHDSSGKPTQPPSGQGASNTTGNVPAPIQKPSTAQSEKHSDGRTESSQLPLSLPTGVGMLSEQPVTEKIIHECNHCGRSHLFEINIQPGLQVPSRKNEKCY